MVCCFSGRGCGLPNRQGSGETAVTEQPCRPLEFQKVGGLLQHLNVPPVINPLKVNPSFSGDLVLFLCSCQLSCLTVILVWFYE